MTAIKKYLLTVLISLPAVSIYATAQIKNAATTRVMIQGASAGCKKIIEAAGFQKHVSLLSWNPQTRQAQLTYNSKATTPEAVLKRVALAGFDNDAYNAPVAAYSALNKECQYKGTRRAAPQAEPADHAQMEHSTAPQASAAASRLEPLYKAYFAVGDALLASDAKATTQKAAELGNVMTAVKREELDNKEHKVWMNVMNGLAKEIAALKTAARIEKQRAAYAALSNTMYQLMKASQSSYKIYYNECPMFNGGARWLSKNETIRNPFYGAKMLSCGSTKAVIE